VVEGRSANSVDTTRAPVGKVDRRYGDRDRGTVWVYRRGAFGSLDSRSKVARLVGVAISGKMGEWTPNLNSSTAWTGLSGGSRAGATGTRMPAPACPRRSPRTWSAWRLRRRLGVYEMVSGVPRMRSTMACRRKRLRPHSIVCGPIAW